MARLKAQIAAAGFAFALAALIGSPASAGAVDVYITNLNPTGSVFQYTITGNRKLAEKSPPSVPGGDHPRAIAITPDGRFAYVVNNAVSEYQIAADGTLTPSGSVSAGLRPQGIAIAPNGRSAYVTNAGDGTVSQYAIGADGQLTPLSPATARTGRGPDGIAMSPDGENLYVTNYDGRDISQYTVIHSGKLVPKAAPTQNAGQFPRGIAVSPDGHSVYVANEYDNSIGQYTIDANGELTPKSPGAVAAGTRPTRIAISPNGRSAYVANRENSGGISQYNVGTDGALSPMSPPTAWTSGRANDIAVAPDGHSAYATTEVQIVNQYTIDPDGSLVHNDTTYSGTRPHAIAIRPDPESAAGTFRVGNLRLNRPRGTAHLKVTTRTSGRLLLAGKRVRRQTKHVRGARTVKIRVWPRPAARRDLRRTGTARVRIKVTFSPADAPMMSKHRTLTLILSRS